MDGTEVGTEVACNTKEAPSKVRCFGFTIYETQMDVWRKNIAMTSPEIIYSIYKKELCPTTNRIHWHGLVYYKNPRAVKAVLKQFSPIHMEVVRSIPKYDTYVRKEETKLEEPIVFGELPEQGRRTDLEDVAEIIRDGATLTDIAVNEPAIFIRYHRGLQALKNAYQKHRSGPPEVYWLWGLAGVGKSRFAYEQSESCYIKDGTMWWDGYEQDDVILIDDFDGRWPFRDLLKLLDRYPYQGQIKGGYVKINSPYIYITCEYPPKKFWEGNELNQVLRRIKVVREVSQLQP